MNERHFRCTAPGCGHRIQVNSLMYSVEDMTDHLKDEHGWAEDTAFNQAYSLLPILTELLP
ncbi:hypothetical protein [Streptomyces showdoensis]|uniref:DUF1059 domain-containing protein n=1 Tax=Streptomyces showdoensis TaxID=68268 RepID=A0A2P2GTS1_STREW|nr:hypothetical protein [Streptomyces showdoensis]KKZ74883.1 hypothetical protein VO63_05405 [Streptomyces showdoensis]